MSAGSIHTSLKLHGGLTDDRLAIVQHTLLPRQLAAPMHRHSREDEISIVLTGRLGAKLGDDIVMAPAGSYLLKPRGQWHTYWNAGASELRLMELLVPGGFEGCLERLAEAMAARVPLEVSTLERIGAEYGVEFDFASISDLCQHFGVTLARWPQRRADRHAGEKYGQHDSVRRPRE